ncbi:hypothetical protein [Nakamurella deserti]|uniref:hypothetical protein n=1 Tax=Nakamurella deserti TaxID=2164074 RepID=UPI001300A9A5|nr:hypothetical protein [Nakamurella deserti]
MTAPTTAVDTAIAEELETAHRRGVGAARAGLQDAALGPVRLTGSGVGLLAEAAVSSATPFLRAPLLSRIGRVIALHPPQPASGVCPSCAEVSPCATLLAVV